MSIRWMQWLLAFLLLTAVSAKADSLTVNGSFAFADQGVGIPPYGGTLNGQNASFYCVDFGHQISGNTGWTVKVTHLRDEPSHLQVSRLVLQISITVT